MIKNKKNIFAITALSFAVAGLPSCHSSKSEKENDTETKQQAPVVVNAFLLKEGNISDTLSIPGELIAFQSVDLFAKVSSFVKKLYVDVGSEVTTGQLLVQMEAPELNSQMEGALSRVKSQEATYLASKANYNRLLETSKTPGTVSQNDLDLANARQKSDFDQLESAKASVREITNTKSYLEIRAPFSGVITVRNVSAGAYAGPGAAGATPLLTLQEQKKLRLVVNVPDGKAGVLTVGQVVAFKIKSLPGQVFTAKVARLSGALDKTLRAQHIEMDVYNNDKKLLPGMIPEVEIPFISDKGKPFVIPQKALLNSTQGIYVIKITNGKTEWIPVSTGMENNSNISVYGNLKAGDTLVSAATEEVRNGEKVGGLAVGSN
ncbi:MAG: efflux RND transporter periplasmic adaptor subunit [Chitinophagaceae bacterium]|jgi:RND family efflux transporter MFP subunit|nr:efflux RND transporter periplasmic adaptor subunit [Chitinophagaceae bacterium]